MEIVGFEHVHLHSDNSLLDGMGMASEYSNRWKTYGGNYLCISDHGTMAAVPDQIKYCGPSGKKGDPLKDKRLYPIFANELYVNPLQIEVDSEKEWEQYKKSLDPEQTRKLSKKGFHLLAIAHNATGYSNLVRLTSLAWTKGYYYGRPRLNHQQLQTYKEGIFFTSCCYASEIAQAFDQGGDDAGFAMVEKYMAMFGENFFLEIMLLDFAKQKPYDEFIIRAHNKYKIPIILTNDCHYPGPEDSKFQHYMLMKQTQSTVADIERRKEEDGKDGIFELQDKNLWMKTEEELNDKWEKDYSKSIDYDLFKQAKLNTVEICKRAKGVELDRTLKLPKLDNADEKLKEAIIAGAKYIGLERDQRYLSRIKEEYSLICHKEFSSYFLIKKMMLDEARRAWPELIGWGDGSEAIGPGRGSAVGSLVCYCLGITDVDPIKHDLLFSRFLSMARGGRSMNLHFEEEDFI